MLILADILEHGPSLKGALNVESLRGSIDKLRGKALVPDSGITNRAGIDFLGIGSEESISFSSLVQ